MQSGAEMLSFTFSENLSGLLGLQDQHSRLRASGHM